MNVLYPNLSVCFFMSQSTAMVMSGQPVSLTILFFLGKFD